MAAHKKSGHTPVLLKEVLHYLDPKPGEFIVDGTVDGGGHARAILERVMPGGRFLGIDWDKRMIEARENERSHGKNEIYKSGNYADLPEILSETKLGKADGLLLDLGFSSEQLSASGRGFSFSEAKADEPLIMTYDDERTPVAELLRTIPEKQLADIIYEFGGERFSRRIAKAIIVERERKKRVRTAGELADIIREATGGARGKYEHGRIDAATRTFQALRIYANDELGNLARALEQLPEVLASGGRAVVITFHSLEDRIAKQSFQKLAKEDKVEILTKKPVEGSLEEIRANPRARSAKVRAVRVR